MPRCKEGFYVSEWRVTCVFLDLTEWKSKVLPLTSARLKMAFDLHLLCLLMASADISCRRTDY